MKKTLSILVALLVITSVTYARRADKPVRESGVAVMNSGSIIKLFYKGYQVTDVKVSIFDSHNNVVFSETLRKVDAFVRPYIFTGLKNGEYTIEVIDGNSLQVRKINYSKGKVTVERPFGLVRIAGDEHKFLLTIPNKGEETITIKIRNNAGELLYTGSEHLQGDFARIYNLQAGSDKVSFEVIDEKGNSSEIKK
jgi:hypothetical protein